MPLRVDEFISEFRKAVESSGPAPRNSKTVRLALRNTKTLAAHLETLNQETELASEIVSVGRITEKLKSMRQSGSLGPLIKKATAFVQLDDFLEADQLREVKELLQQAKALKGRRDVSQKYGPLEYQVTATCEDCNEVIVGIRGGVGRWQRVQAGTANHERKIHHGELDAAKELTPAFEKLNEGRQETRIGRYLFVRT